jgi:hypothetical protein
LGSNPKGGHSTYTLALLGCTLELGINDIPGHTEGRELLNYLITNLNY